VCFTVILDRVIREYLYLSVTCDERGRFMASYEMISNTASIDEKTKLPARIFVGANVNVYGEVLLGEDIWIEPNVIVYGPAEIGARSYIGPSSFIGHPSKEELQWIISTRDKRMKLERGKMTKIGKNVVIRSNCIFYSDVDVGDDSRLGHNVLIRENVHIGEESLVGTNTVIDGKCRIGSNVSIQSDVYISTNTTIEDCVFLGPRCVLINDRYVMQKDCELVGPTIRQGASIGANSTIFPGVVVGEGAIVGAGAVVMENVPPRKIVVGVPAKELKNVPDDWQIKLKKNV